MRISRKNLSAIGLGAAMLWGWSGMAVADDYCCICNQSKSISIESSDELSAGLECSLKCRKPVKGKPGKCGAPSAPSAAPSTAAPAGGAPAHSSGSRVALFSSEDCSGEAKSVTETTARLAASGVRSYRVESGDPATAFEKADFGGRRVEPVGVGMCVSPGFDVNAVRIGKQ